MLFLGRKVYFGAVVVVVSVLHQGPNATRLSQLQEWVGVSERTVKRWRQWWLSSFAGSRFWRMARGLLKRALDEKQLPLSLLESFEGEQAQDRLVQLLQFLRPVTSCSGAWNHEF